jgi:CDGSH-type Zn-finger protein
VNEPPPIDSARSATLSSELRTRPTVTVYPDGPLILRGGVVVQDVAGEVLSAGRVVALCRCGRSARKPLCDGSHRCASVVRPDGTTSLNAPSK